MKFTIADSHEDTIVLIRTLEGSTRLSRRAQAVRAVCAATMLMLGGFAAALPFLEPGPDADRFLMLGIGLLSILGGVLILVDSTSVLEVDELGFHRRSAVPLMSWSLASSEIRSIELDTVTPASLRLTPTSGLLARSFELRPAAIDRLSALYPRLAFYCEEARFPRWVAWTFASLLGLAVIGSVVIAFVVNWLARS